MHKRSWVTFMCTAGNGWSDRISRSTVGSCCDFGTGSVCRVLSRLDVRKPLGRAGKPLSPLMCACTIVPRVCPHAAEALLIREAFQRYPVRCPDREEVQLGFDFLGQSTRVIVWGRDFQGLESLETMDLNEYSGKSIFSTSHSNVSLSHCCILF